MLSWHFRGSGNGPRDRNGVLEHMSVNQDNHLKHALSSKLTNFAKRPRDPKLIDRLIWGPGTSPLSLKSVRGPSHFPRKGFSGNQAGNI